MLGLECGSRSALVEGGETGPGSGVPPAGVRAVERVAVSGGGGLKVVLFAFEGDGRGFNTSCMVIEKGIVAFGVHALNLKRKHTGKEVEFIGVWKSIQLDGGTVHVFLFDPGVGQRMGRIFVTGRRVFKQEVFVAMRA